MKKRDTTRSRRTAARPVAAMLSALMAASCSGPSTETSGTANLGGAPLIGITSNVKEGSTTAPSDYARAVVEAGGLPVILPPTDDDAVRAEYVRQLDGLVLSGGADIPPDAYGEKPHPTVKTMPKARWDFDSKLIADWLATGKPVLGICLGTQEANVVLGGSLIQDVPSEIGGQIVHGQPPKEEPEKDAARTGEKKGSGKKAARGKTDPCGTAAKLPPVTHPVTLAPDSRLHDILGMDRLTVASSHHQAIERLGRDLRVTANSDDGVIEALELPGHRWAVFVQWHPERMDRAHRDVLFGALVRACREAEGGE